MIKKVRQTEEGVTTTGKNTKAKEKEKRAQMERKAREKKEEG